MWSLQQANVSFNVGSDLLVKPKAQNLTEDFGRIASQLLTAKPITASAQPVHKSPQLTIPKP